MWKRSLNVFNASSGWQTMVGPSSYPFTSHDTPSTDCLTASRCSSTADRSHVLIVIEVIEIITFKEVLLLMHENKCLWRNNFFLFFILIHKQQYLWNKLDSAQFYEAFWSVPSQAGLSFCFDFSVVSNTDNLILMILMTRFNCTQIMYFWNSISLSVFCFFYTLLITNYKNLIENNFNNSISTELLDLKCSGVSWSSTENFGILFRHWYEHDIFIHHNSLHSRWIKPVFTWKVTPVKPTTILLTSSWMLSMETRLL